MHRKAIKAVAKFIYPATRREEGREASRTWVELEEEEEACVDPGRRGGEGAPSDLCRSLRPALQLRLRLRSPAPSPSWAVPGAPRCTSLTYSLRSPAATVVPFSTINLATHQSAAIAVDDPRALFQRQYEMI